MALSPAAAKHVARRLGDGTDPESVVAYRARDLIAECDRVLHRARAAAKRIKERGPRAPQKAPEPPRREVVADLRAAVIARCGSEPCCEWCGASLRVAGFELHHVLSGPDRRAEERPETVAGVCLFCHRQYHRNDVGTLRDAKTWALRRGFMDAFKAIDRRIEKLSAQHPEATP